MILFAGFWPAHDFARWFFPLCIIVWKLLSSVKMFAWTLLSNQLGSCFVHRPSLGLLTCVQYHRDKGSKSRTTARCSCCQLGCSGSQNFPCNLGSCYILIGQAQNVLGSNLWGWAWFAGLKCGPEMRAWNAGLKCGFRTAIQAKQIALLCLYICVFTHIPNIK